MTPAVVESLQAAIAGKPRWASASFGRLKNQIIQHPKGVDDYVYDKTMEIVGTEQKNKEQRQIMEQWLEVPTVPVSRSNSYRVERDRPPHGSPQQWAVMLQAHQKLYDRATEARLAFEQEVARLERVTGLTRSSNPNAFGVPEIESLGKYQELKKALIEAYHNYATFENTNVVFKQVAEYLGIMPDSPIGPASDAGGFYGGIAERAESLGLSPREEWMVTQGPWMPEKPASWGEHKLRTPLSPAQLLEYIDSTGAGKPPPDWEEETTTSPATTSSSDVSGGKQGVGPDDPIMPGR